MSASPNKPAPWANRLNKLLDQFHAIHGGDRFPVDVEALIREVPGTFRTGEPITIQGEAMDPEFEGALFNLNADEPGKGNWLSSALNRVLTPVTTVTGYLHHSLMKFGMSRGLAISRLRAPIIRKVRQFAVSAKM